MVNTWVFETQNKSSPELTPPPCVHHQSSNDFGLCSLNTAKHIFKTNWAAYFFDNMRIHQSTPKHEYITKFSENNQTHSSQVDRMWHTLRYLPPTNTGMRQHMVANSQGVIGYIVQDEKKIKSLGCRPCLVTMDWFLTSILTSSDVRII